MTTGLITVIAIVILAIIFVASGLRIVQQSDTVIIERFGKYHSTLSAGINIIIPFVDKPREIMWRYSKETYDGKSIVIKRATNKIDLRETVYDFPKQNVITKDNVVTEINAILYFQVMDPIKATYEISNLPDAIEKLTQTTLRNVIGDMSLDETLTSRDTINAKLRNVLDEASHKWGVKVNRVELQDINPPHDIRDAMEKQMRAERDKRAKILEAEADKQSQILQSEGWKTAVINKAEAEKQSKILKAEGDAEARIRTANGEAEAINVITTAIKNTNSDPVNYMVAIRYIDTLNQMVSGKDNKTIYMPYEATGVLSSLGGIKNMFNATK
ncbi:MAG: SPFH/Band 7/PHB domain protein [Bacteroidales bacterium]|jgi:regulator of protease activity HflC (stomatin/prohibitin superfamily)|nr:SPFH/Band 7/PHB domain protein [Bacteroidales bacterium]MBQ4477692.1 SPFH/Band 7/PHB domain protein [Bacteroidales bacterium]MBR4453923.1 SPFH/Band 7/PHB domain protein [Bacteroidales bacterium]MCR5554492.1 SPFH/Band 7/PHB domain protein [Bacteroidales bacterium]